MKSIFSFIISLSLSLLTTYNLSAQHSLLHGDNSWMVYYETMESSDYLFGQIVYYNNTPFHVDGKRYETMIISHNSNVRDYYSNKDKYPELYYREEANKIIRYDPYAEADIIMFEFGHEVGDTLTDGDGNTTNFDPDNGDVYKCEITDATGTKVTSERFYVYKSFFN